MLLLLPKWPDHPWCLLSKQSQPKFNKSAQTVTVDTQTNTRSRIDFKGKYRPFIDPSG